MNNKHSVVFPLTYRLSGQYLSGSILSGSSLLPNFVALHLDVNSIVRNKISAKAGASVEIKNIGLRLKSLYFCRKEGHFLLDGFEQTHGYAALQGNLKPIWLSDV